MTADFVTSLGTLLVGVIGAGTALILALRKRISEEELPEARRFIAEQARRIAQLETELAAARQDVLAGDVHIYDLERAMAQHGLEPPPRPSGMDAAAHTARQGRWTRRPPPPPTGGPGG